MGSSIRRRAAFASLTLAFLGLSGAPLSRSQTTGTSESPAATADLGEIVVTGIRASLERAQDVKRAATSVVEAITPEDLGHFTDDSLADALQRVPGVQVDANASHINSNGSGVTVRGLGADFVITTLNGRNVLGNPAFGGGSFRSVDFDSIPPEVISGLLVYKAPTSSMVESGIAGEIDIQTLKPFD